MDLSWKPLLGFFYGQLKWVETLCLTKNITLQIIDESVATIAEQEAARTEGFSFLFLT